MPNEINMLIEDDITKLYNVAYALASYQRIDILRLLIHQTYSVKEIAKLINTPLSTTILHLNALETAGIIEINQKINEIGKVKYCSRIIDNIKFNLLKSIPKNSNEFLTSIPIGNYTDYKIIGYGNIATNKKILGVDDRDYTTFFHQERYKAGIIWFQAGFLEYRFVTKDIPSKIKSLTISFEACSEAHRYRNDWKSDITLSINGIEIGTIFSPGDFGGRNGNLNPSWWGKELTQYGLLFTIEINEEGTFCNESKISAVTLNNIKLFVDIFSTLKIAVKTDAKYCGGLNLFGSSFGDYPQDIDIKFVW
ncbi:MAG: helix-turn-helix domain-containing protein [Bacillales bacterium]|jgi:predicted transcriptional regulator|nr:helix-turn-helix domain-containing protein [Bacillales bacterium]